MSDQSGRGEVATADMKVRIAALRAQGRDVVGVLWERHHRAVLLGQGFTYECAAPDSRRLADV